MKRTALLIACAAMCATCFAFPKALYVKKGDTFTRYNFGVAENLKFGDDGKTLSITGYNETINLGAIDYITFTAPVDNTALTPAAQKEKLVQIGDDFARTFINPAMSRNQDLTVMADQFCRQYADYYIDPKYYDVHGSNDDEVNSPMNPLSALLKSIGAVANGNVAAMRTAQLNGVELYQCSDWFGVFAANPDTREWEKTADAGYLQISFPAPDGASFVAKLTTSAEYTDWTEIDFVGRVPQQVVVTLSKGSTTLATVKMRFTVNNTMKAINIFSEASLSPTFDMAQGYFANCNTNITNDAIACQLNAYLDGQQMVSANARVNGVRLTNYEGWKEDVDNTHDGYDYYDPETERWEWIEGNREQMVANHFTYATASATIMNQLQLTGKVSSIGHLYEICNEDTWIDGAWEHGVWDNVKNTCTFTYDDINVVKKQVSHLNDYSDISFSYLSESGIQGYLGWDVNEDIESWDSDGYWDDQKQEWVERYYTNISKYYETMPLIIFPDGTSFAIEDYFNEDDFSRLVDDYNDIIDLYYQISGAPRYDDDDDY